MYNLLDRGILNGHLSTFIFPFATCPASGEFFELRVSSPTLLMTENCFVCDSQNLGLHQFFKEHSLTEGRPFSETQYELSAKQDHKCKHAGQAKNE
ncbi:hypothetical protein NPIL_79711 [Nephila pilipes]|uniref:Uncharacterized protein n=1 Tax=Nephila pilipes TaxID=299642 RepID=A0A8X6IB12_NEPPI|nr:hypothetical protein NPIL_79711 [Nephila pilipes]